MKKKIKDEYLEVFKYKMGDVVWFIYQGLIHDGRILGFVYSRDTDTVSLTNPRYIISFYQFGRTHTVEVETSYVSSSKRECAIYAVENGLVIMGRNEVEVDE